MLISPMIEKINLCIFDLDGLLIDSERYIWIRGEKIIGKEFNIEITDEFALDALGSNFISYSQKLKNKFGKDFPADKFLNRLMEFFDNTVKTDIVPIKDGVISLLEFCKNNNIKTSIGTSTHKEEAETILKKCDLYKYFDYFVFGDEVKNGKPNPEIYLKSVNHFGFKLNECIIFEDSQNGAQTAYNANIPLVLVPDLQKPNQNDINKAFKILKSVDEIIPIIKSINKIE